ncbi:MAG: hypothetical protein ACPHL6_01770 [Rubripirellula sp.]
MNARCDTLNDDRDIDEVPQNEQDVRMAVDPDRSTIGVIRESVAEQMGSTDLPAPPVLFTLRSLSRHERSRSNDSEVRIREGCSHLRETTQETLKASSFDSSLTLEGEVSDTKLGYLRNKDNEQPQLLPQSSLTGEGEELDRSSHFSDVDSLVAGKASTAALSTLSASSKKPADIEPERPVEVAVQKTSMINFSGRSWFRTAGSHGLVIVLLLSVVAAALLSGDSSSSITPEQADLLTFDGSVIELPLPDMMEIDLGELESEIVTSETPQGATKANNQLNESLADSTSSLLDAGSDVGSAKESLVTGTSFSGDSSHLETSGTVNALLADSGIEATEVESKLLPSLEQLAENPTNSILDMHAGSNGSEEPIQTSTPRDIDDWLKFLPPVERIASDSDSSVSSTK